MQGAFDAKLNLNVQKKNLGLEMIVMMIVVRKMKTMQRGSSGIYFPHLETSILIPPYSKMIDRKIEMMIIGQSKRKDLEIIYTK